MKSPPKLFASISVHSRFKFPDYSLYGKNSMLMDKSRLRWKSNLSSPHSGKVSAETVPVNPLVGNFDSNWRGERLSNVVRARSR